VAQWRAERPDLAEDEFIDDIPFPETQNYVKRILGTAEDYRRLYGSGLLNPNDPLSRGTVMPKPSVRTVKSSTTTKKTTSTSKKTTTKKAPAKKTPAKSKSSSKR
jgi:soluble lytic murein transglycosylase